MKDIDIKKVILALIIVIIVIIGIFFAIKTIFFSDKNYVLEEISEEDYKYFVVYTERKVRSIK